MAQQRVWLLGSHAYDNYSDTIDFLHSLRGDLTIEICDAQMQKRFCTERTWMLQVFLFRNRRIMQYLKGKHIFILKS